MQAPGKARRARRTARRCLSAPELKSASATPPAQPVAMPDDGPAIAAATEVPAGHALSNLDTRPDTHRDETTNSPALSAQFADTKADMRGSPGPDNHPPASGREAVLAAFNRPRQPAPQPRPQRQGHARARDERRSGRRVHRRLARGKSRLAAAVAWRRARATQCMVVKILPGFSRVWPGRSAIAAPSWPAWYLMRNTPACGVSGLPMADCPTWRTSLGRRMRRLPCADMAAIKVIAEGQIATNRALAEARARDHGAPAEEQDLPVHRHDAWRGRRARRER
jgi:hypothetical protein